MYTRWKLVCLPCVLFFNLGWPIANADLIEGKDDSASLSTTNSTGTSTLLSDVAKADDVLATAAKSAMESIAARDLESARKSLASLPVSDARVHSEILLAELLFASNLPGDARSVLEEFAVKSPRRLDVYLAFCELAIQERRWFDGYNLALVAERLPPDTSWSTEFAQQLQQRIKTIKALCAENRRDWKVAMDTYQSVNDVKPTVQSLAGLGRVAYRMGDIPKAIDYFTKLRELEPTTAAPQLLIAELFNSDNKEEEAKQAYTKATESKNPADRSAARLSMARYLIRMNAPAQAKPLLEEAIGSAKADEMERRFLQALVARLEKRNDDAKKILSELHQEQPDSFPIGNHLALVLAQTNDESLRARAMQIATGNVRNYEKSADAWATLGWIQFRLGDRAAAEASLTNAAKLGALSRDTLYYLLELKRAAGDAKAVEILTAAHDKAVGPNFYAN